MVCVEKVAWCRAWNRRHWLTTQLVLDRLLLLGADFNLFGRGGCGLESLIVCRGLDILVLLPEGIAHDGHLDWMGSRRSRAQSTETASQGSQSSNESTNQFINQWSIETGCAVDDVGVRMSREEQEEEEEEEDGVRMSMWMSSQSGWDVYGGRRIVWSSGGTSWYRGTGASIHFLRDGGVRGVVESQMWRKRRDYCMYMVEVLLGDAGG